MLDNVYFKKSFNQILDNLEPRFKKIEHEINVGETFNEILEQYLVEKSEIDQIKKELSKKINLNKLNVNQKFIFKIDNLSKEKIIEFRVETGTKNEIIFTKAFDGKKFISERKKIILSDYVINSGIGKNYTLSKIKELIKKHA